MRDEMATVKRTSGNPDKKSSDSKSEDKDKTVTDDDKKDSKNSKDNDDSKYSGDDKDKDDEDDDKNDGKDKKNENDDKDDKDDKKDGGKKKGIGDHLKKHAAHGAAGMAAHGAAKLAMIQMMMKLLTMMIQAIQAVITAVAQIVQAVIALVVQLAVTVAAAIGVTVAAAVFGIVGIFALAVVVVGVAVYDSVTSSSIAERDSAVVQKCTVEQSDYFVDSLTDVDAQMIANAQQVYSVMSTYGFADEDIAGMLGNLQHESYIDPTGIEGIYYSEKYNIRGSQKAAAIAMGWESYTVGKLGKQKDGYKAADGHYYCGIGLMQFTADNNIAIREFAEANNADWWDLDIQLAFMLYHYNGFNGWTPNNPDIECYGGVDGASDSFCLQIERPSEANRFLQIRRDYAHEWYTRMKEWQVDSVYAATIIEMANTAIRDGVDMAGQKANDTCHMTFNYSNASIARSALSVAWKSYDNASGNDGTDLYVYLVQKIFANENPALFADSSRFISTIIRWSGADDDFPPQDIDAQLAYLTSATGTWKEIKKKKFKNLESGDILINSKTKDAFIYVGEGLCRSYLLDTESACNAVCLGRNEYVSPYISAEDVKKACDSYRVFRCLARTGTKYRTASVGFTGSDSQ